MRFLHLVHRSWPYHGGAERYVWEHALAAVKRGHSSTIATTDAWDMSWFVSQQGRHLHPGRTVHRGVEIIRFPVLHPPAQSLLRAVLRRVVRGGPDRFYYPNPFIPLMDRWIGKASGYDIVHANAMPFLINAGYRYALANRVPLISVPHANLGTASHRISPLHYFAGRQKEILRYSSLTVAQNRYEASVYRDECGVPEEKILIHGSGVDPDEWVSASGDTARKALSLPENSRIVLSVTAHCLDKGSVSLLNSCIALWRKGHDFTLVLAGPVMADFRDHLDRIAGDVSPEKLVVTGYIPESIRTHLFSAATVVAAPSRLDAFGIVLLDGWMGNSPVIGCNAGGMPDIIDDGIDGYLVEFGDEEALSERIITLLENDKLAADMARGGKEKVNSCYTWEKVTDRFFQQLEERNICRE